MIQTRNWKTTQLPSDMDMALSRRNSRIPVCKMTLGRKSHPTLKIFSNHNQTRLTTVMNLHLHLKPVPHQMVTGAQDFGRDLVRIRTRSTMKVSTPCPAGPLGTPQGDPTKVERIGDLLERLLQRETGRLQSGQTATHHVIVNGTPFQGRLGPTPIGQQNACVQVLWTSHVTTRQLRKTSTGTTGKAP